VRSCGGTYGYCTSAAAPSSDLRARLASSRGNTMRSPTGANKLPPWTANTHLALAGDDRGRRRCPPRSHLGVKERDAHALALTDKLRERITQRRLLCLFDVCLLRRARGRTDPLRPVLPHKRAVSRVGHDQRRALDHFDRQGRLVGAALFPRLSSLRRVPLPMRYEYPPISTLLKKVL
jgi:hypothetical protein